MTENIYRVVDDHQTHLSRHCVYCGKVGPRVPWGGGFAHRRCIPRPPKRRAKPPADKPT